MDADWIDRLEDFRRLDGPTRRVLAEAARVMTVPAGQTVFSEGAECGAYLFVLEGSVRVQMVAETGREIVLYRVENGQSCILTTACLLADRAYNAEGVTETDVTAVALPAATFHRLLAQSEAFRQAVFNAYGERIAGLLMLIEEVAFGRVDLRLARFLLDRRDGAGVLAATHQTLAVELGTAREVISRQLKEFERRGWVALSRGRVAVTDARALAAHAGTDLPAV